MAENVTPTSAKPTTPANGLNSADRGIPYYESLRRSLRDTISRKRVLDRSLSQLEESIYRAETSYLEETSVAGNIVKGFDNYIKASASSAVSAGGAGTVSGAALGGIGGRAGARKGGVKEEERVFSRSSIAWTQTREGGDTTASGAATPTVAHSREGSVIGEKRERKGRKKGSVAAAVHIKEDEDGDGRTKRQKISFTGRKREDD